MYPESSQFSPISSSMKVHNSTEYVWIYVTEFPSCSLSPPSHPLVPSLKAITVIHLKQWLVTNGDFVSPGEYLAMSANDFGVKIGGKLLTSSGQRPEKLLKILQCIGKHPPHPRPGKDLSYPTSQSQTLF